MHHKGLLCLFVLALFPLPSAGGHSFGMDPVWDDGLAEVAVYQAKKLIYGKLWDHETVLATVKEDLSKEYYVKADPPYAGKDLLPVIKQNIFTRIQTYNYPYHYLISVFVEKNNLEVPVKMTVSSQEWCGNTFKEYKLWKKPAEILYHSYFDRQGDGRAALEHKKGNMLREQLYLSLRALDFKEGLKKNFKLLDAQMTNKFTPPKWRSAELMVTGKEEVEAMGKKIPCWRVDVVTDNDKMSFWFEDEFPHALVRYTNSYGEEMLLQEISRRAYWQF